MPAARTPWGAPRRLPALPWVSRAPATNHSDPDQQRRPPTYGSSCLDLDPPARMADRATLGSSQLGLRNGSSALFILRFSRGLSGSFLLSALLGSGLGVSVAVDGSTGGGLVADACRLPSHPRPWYEDPGKARLKTMGPLPGRAGSVVGTRSTNRTRIPSLVPAVTYDRSRSLREARPLRRTSRFLAKWSVSQVPRVCTRRLSPCWSGDSRIGFVNELANTTTKRPMPLDLESAVSIGRRCWDQSMGRLLAFRSQRTHDPGRRTARRPPSERVSRWPGANRQRSSNETPGAVFASATASSRPSISSCATSLSRRL
jgi:hypothetical protein